MLNKLHIYNLFVPILFQTCHLAQRTLNETKNRNFNNQPN